MFTQRQSKVDTRPWTGVIVALAAASVLLAGCDGGSGGGTATTPTTGGAASASAGTTPSGSVPPDRPADTQQSGSGRTGTATTGGGGGLAAPTATTDVTWTGTGSGTPAAVLTAVRVADQGSFDRLVLQFDRPISGYRVGYVPAVDEDPSGRPVPLQGTAFLRIVVQGATADNAYQAGGDIPHASYPGPRTLTPGLPAIRQVADAGDFESVLSFGVGLAHRTGFRVSRLDGPARLVLDVAH